jgi:hypothetical protein
VEQEAGLVVLAIHRLLTLEPVVMPILVAVEVVAHTHITEQLVLAAQAALVLSSSKSQIRIAQSFHRV